MTCRNCGGERRNRGPDYCSAGCAEEATIREAQERAAVGPPEPVSRCRNCGDEFVGHVDFCSGVCAEEHNADAAYLKALATGGYGP